MDPFVLLIAIVLFTLFGVMAGVGTGLVPGIHVNNVALIVYVSQAALSGVVVFIFGWAAPSSMEIMLILSSLIIATAVSHTFINFIPSVFLGAPDENTALSVLPGHKMLLSGKGYEAVHLAVHGCFWGFIASFILIFPLRLLMGSPVNAYEKLRPVMAGILALVVTLLIYSEGKKRIVTGQVRVKAREIGGVQLISELEGVHDVPPWPELTPGEEVFLDGKIVRIWNGGFLFVRGSSRVIVSTHDDCGDFEGSWIRVSGLVLPETRIASDIEQRAWAVLLFLIAGAIGWVLLSTSGVEAANWYPIPALASRTSSMMLFPLFTGLFGLSTMILSGASRESLPEQDINHEIKMESWRQARAVVCGTTAGAAVSWFPGVSGASATVISRYLAGGDTNEEQGDNNREFLISIGAANAASTVFTLVALFVILKGRSGAAATIGSLLSVDLSSWEPLTFVPLALSLLLVSCIVAASIAFILSKRLARFFAKKCGKIRYGILIRAVIVFLVAAVFLLTGALGLLVAGATTTLGLVPPLVGVRRVHLMGCLILPAIIILAF